MKSTTKRIGNRSKAPGGSGPERSTEGDQILLEECRPVPVPLDVLEDGGLVPADALEEGSLAVEASNLHPETVESRPDEVAGLGEEGAQGSAAVLEPARIVPDAEAHRRGPRPDAEFAQQTGEARVVDLVVDDEPGVHIVGASPEIEAERVRVAADPARRLVDGDRVARMEVVGSGKPRDSGTDNRHLHRGRFTSGQSEEYLYIIYTQWRFMLTLYVQRLRWRGQGYPPGGSPAPGPPVFD